ncbi:Periplasmic aromatic aldehyde oxidoreductase, molybdenum binding subunit YagR [Cystobacter fuscus DSM 2262]|uniref:Periplasmic aromatic aldehyde oxidoreductase, molybdenum binding subunit YagR n=1 Tax=Cystobacter fuscus (strain ATCC 25194 / DSM 2262 / NBRC 100088 / M29) TaxID=1242864 RepID=S9PQT0_CYSF2|nr:xanthine dehydrogenase family protein molybdopterin-binding subunit [Cystobacter fuscus]EPX64872.1 Periplasmic aromatic aldehyde oxidoreductase, molybdenum binding subunit YagR [Cystobacter fuscus DSM 2262]
MNGKLIGNPVDRVDGRLKVTGKATYAAENHPEGMVYAAIVQSTVPRGSVLRMQTGEAEKAPGVLKVLTPRNMPKPGGLEQYSAIPMLPKLGIMQDSEVLYNGQPIALVVADTFERAVHAASLVRATYVEKPAILDLEKARANAQPAPGIFGGPPPGHTRGDVEAGLKAGPARVEATYVTPTETHHPMEPHATVAVWTDPEHLTLYDANQGVHFMRQFLSMLFAMPQENIHVRSPFVGGGFGCKALPWSHVVLSILAAKEVGRPVKIVLTRQQMSMLVGYRPTTVQKVELAASPKGQLTALRHTGFSELSEQDSFAETFTAVSGMLYACPNVTTSQQVVRLSTSTPTFMRGPGEAPGTFALESALDELAHQLKMDPLELRRINHADKDPEHGRPWSSKSLLECYRVGAERFGWKKRPLAPRSLREGDKLIGWGMATATFPAMRGQAAALARVLPDGTAVVQCGGSDLGTGAYTVLTQVAADALGMSHQKVRMEMGDSQLPLGPLAGGSMSTATASPAVQGAAASVREQLVKLAVADKASPLHGLAEKDVLTEDGRLFSRKDKSKGETYAQLLTRQQLPHVEGKGEAAPKEEEKKYSSHSFGAHFVEVRVDEALGTVRVSRIVSTMAAGRILNAKTASSQISGGVIFGLGMALTEETLRDPRNGRVMTADLADYHVPVQADVPKIDVQFIEEEDKFVNPLGIKGIGEIATTGVAAAVANAVFHATGKRIRELPITLDKLM